MIALGIVALSVGVVLLGWPTVLTRLAGHKKPLPWWAAGFIRLWGIIEVIQGLYWCGVPVATWLPPLRHILIPPLR